MSRHGYHPYARGEQQVMRCAQLFTAPVLCARPCLMLSVGVVGVQAPLAGGGELMREGGRDGSSPPRERVKRRGGFSGAVSHLVQVLALGRECMAPLLTLGILFGRWATDGRDAGRGTSARRRLRWPDASQPGSRAL